MDEKPLIFNIQRFSVHDGPGIRTTVFLKGCPMRCGWCCNPESQSPARQLQFFPGKCIGCGRCAACAYGAVSGKGFDRGLCQSCMACAAVCKSGARKCAGDEKTVGEVVAAIEKDHVFYKNSGGGVTFSGGEPMLYPGFIREAAIRCKDAGVTVAVETCGHVPWKSFETALPFVDFLLFDVKTMDSALHKRYCGVGNKRVLENLARASGCRAEVIVRIPVLPGINDGETNLERTASFMKAHGLATAHLLPYHDLALYKYDSLGIPYPLKGTRPPEDARMRDIQKTLEAFGLMVQIGG